MAQIGILGAHGNMGKRYSLITKALGHRVVEVDVGMDDSEIETCDGVIIATPTDTHIDLIKRWRHKPILCEKPISKKFSEIEDLFYPLRPFRKEDKSSLNVRMINQYEYYILCQKELDKMVKKVPYYNFLPYTFFNYYRHGNDGLIWDCINIVGLSIGKIELHENSFIWKCTINNQQLSIGEMDGAYVWNIRDWTTKLDDNHSYIIHAHKKCSELEKNAH